MRKSLPYDTRLRQIEIKSYSSAISDSSLVWKYLVGHLAVVEEAGNDVSDVSYYCWSHFWELYASRSSAVASWVMPLKLLQWSAR